MKPLSAPESIPGLSRRDFLGTAALAGAMALGTRSRGVLAAAEGPSNRLSPAPTRLVDVNVTLSRWPARRLPLDDTPALVARLRQRGVTQAWAGSFDGLLHRDLAAVNRRLAEECRRHGRQVLVPFGSVNPMLPGWPDELRRCREEHQMPGIRLYPNYHGYKLDDAVLAELLVRAAACGLIVQIALSLEDERVQTPLLRVPPVDPLPLPGLLRTCPSLRLIVLNACRALTPESAARLTRTGRLYFDIAMLEGVAGICTWLKQLPADRLLFGSHAPFFYFESALPKLKESELSPGQLAAIGFGNSLELLAG